MAKNDDDTLALVPIDAIVAATGWTEIKVRGQVKQSEIHTDWNGAECVLRSRARELRTALLAEKDEYDRAQREAMDRQLDLERDSRLRQSAILESVTSRGFSVRARSDRATPRSRRGRAG